MNDKVSPAFSFGLALGSLLFLAIIFFTNAKTESAWQREAVKAGKAEYYLDENYERQWRWK